uniref:Glutathione peroxidase 3 n=1 Tax=Monodelphis domestica TaxID=13616 RepID=A0A5F8GIZ7_MONDO
FLLDYAYFLLVFFFLIVQLRKERRYNKYLQGITSTIYDYGALTIDGDEYIPFKQYAGKYILFVNVATY